MSTQLYRIQPVIAGLAKECLAERLHIYTNWPAIIDGQLIGEAHFDNAWYLIDTTSQRVVAKDSQPAPPLSISLADAVAHKLTLPGPITEITGEHVMAFIKSLHAQRIEMLLSPDSSPQPTEAQP